MSAVRHTDAFAQRHFSETVVFGALLLVVLFSLPFLRGSFWWQAIAVALAIWAIGYYRHQRRFHHFCCPSCDSMLHRTKAPRGEPVTFSCSLCETVWDTNFRE